MKKIKKYFFTVMVMIFVLSFAVIGTIAYLNTLNGLDNTFVQGTVDPEIIETFENNKKTNVKIKNTGNIPVYVRCKVTIYEELTDSSVSEDILKKDVDFTITYPNDFDMNWIQIDDIYYYKQPVQPGKETCNLLNECVLKKKGIVVDISAQTIQTSSQDAVKEAWKDIDVKENGTLFKKDSIAISQENEYLY